MQCWVPVIEVQGGLTWTLSNYLKKEFSFKWNVLKWVKLSFNQFACLRRDGRCAWGGLAQDEGATIITLIFIRSESDHCFALLVAHWLTHVLSRLDQCYSCWWRLLLKVVDLIAMMYFLHFYRTRVRSLAMLVSNWLPNWLTDWLTHSCLVDLMAANDTNC